MEEAIRNETGEAVSAEQLAQINAFSRRELTAEEVYVFSLVLCDNEVDRDFERFPAESLERLAELFVGKTGIFDHVAKGENQTARIFETVVEPQEGRTTEAGEGYLALRAWAYMMRCEKNADLILEIDAGIKKEVSVSCAVAQMICSVCGADAKRDGCAHQPGESYDGKLCWRELVGPTDAYEWSFVAVPAQKRAGVTKHWEEFADEVRISKAQMEQQTRLLEELQRRCAQREEQLRKQVVRLGAFALPDVAAKTLEQVAGRMNEEELEALCKGMSKGTPMVQLAGGSGEQREQNGAFVI